MKIITANCLGKAHELAVQYVLQNGTYVKTEDGEDTIETDEICICVENPETLPKFSQKSKIKENFLNEYASNLMQGSDNVFEYDYHTRLFQYGNTDQIDYIIKKLQKQPNSRRALAITWIPEQDQPAKDVPCLQLIQFVIRDHKLCMKVVFRSNDVLTALGANMYALTQLQKYVAIRVTKGKIGAYTHIALVPHIYYKRDADDISAFCCKGIYLPTEIVCKSCKKCVQARHYGAW